MNHSINIKTKKQFKETTMIEKLPEGHIIKTMVQEHEQILGVLDDLTQVSNKLSDTDPVQGEKLMSKCNQLAVKLIMAEPHHKREEDVLFIEMEKHGIIGPTQVMRSEHDEMRKLKHQLKEKTASNDTTWNLKVSDITWLIDQLCNTLRSHIEKENTFLYPLALRAITDDLTWKEMKLKCDQIGYCCFCPHEKEKTETQELINNPEMI